MPPITARAEADVTGEPAEVTAINRQHHLSPVANFVTMRLARRSTGHDSRYFTLEDAAIFRRFENVFSRIPYGTAAAFAAAMMLVASSGRRKRCATREFAAAVTLAT